MNKNKILVVLMLFIACEVCSHNVKELTKKEKEKLMPYPKDFSIKANELEYAILHSQLQPDTDIIKYYMAMH